MKIRKAYPHEAGHLTDLAVRSKAYWGYDSLFMQACELALKVEPQDLKCDASLFEVCTINNSIVGFYGVELKSSESAELDYLFVEPSAMGSGVGRALLSHAIQSVERMGISLLQILSDPGAKAFYLACGAEFVGYRESDAIEGRQLPLLQFTVRELNSV